MALQRQALIDVVTRVGPCVLLGFSQGGGFVFDAADAARDLVRACIALEPHGVPASFDAGLPGTPALVVFGDFIEEDEAWRAHSARANASMAAWNAAGGRGERIDLPALGMRGNTHMMMMDTNSDDVFRIVLDWLDGCAGMRVPG
jgi:pimeloyl-ACP methyl ester carboxylesterase